MRTCDVWALLRLLAEIHDLTEVARALRSMTSHNMPSRGKGDTEVVGANTVKYMRENTMDMEDMIHTSKAIDTNASVRSCLSGGISLCSS